MLVPGNINIGFPTALKEKLKLAQNKVKGQAKNALAFVKMMPDGLSFAFSDPVTAIACGSEISNIATAFTFGFGSGIKGGSVNTKQFAERSAAQDDSDEHERNSRNIGSEVHVAEIADEDDWVSESPASSRKLTAISADSWRESSNNLVEDRTVPTARPTATPTATPTFNGGSYLPNTQGGKVDSNLDGYLDGLKLGFSESSTHHHVGHPYLSVRVQALATTLPSPTHS